MKKHLDLTKPETLHRLAALPHYGQAISVLRGPFPEWGIDPDVEHEFTVRMEREVVAECCCNCPHCDRSDAVCETRKVQIEAHTIQEAIEQAEIENPEWEVADCRLTHSVNLDVPSWIYEPEGSA